MLGAAAEAPLRPLTFAERAERYARDVRAGHVVAGKWTKAACQRHLDDLERSVTDTAWPYHFDAEKAGRPCHFLQCLPHTKGEWAKARIENGAIVRPRIVLEDWQVFLVAVAFGWVNRLTGLRRFRRIYLEIARKNAKSTLAAGLALYLLTADGEVGAEVYSVATKKDQAKVVWNDACEMIRLEPEFRAMPPQGLGCVYNARAIYQRHTNSRYEPLGRDSDSLDGLNTHAFVSDELHAQKDRGAYDVLDSSTGARAQPLGIGITTAGTNQAGICFEQRVYVARILNTTLQRHGGMGYRIEGDGIVDDTYFGMIFTLDSGYADGRPDDHWSDEAAWPKANPNLGISVSIEDMRAKCVKAKASAQSQPEFRTKHCNQWLSADTAWMDMVKWHACADPALKEEDFIGETCYEGLDSAFKVDVFAKAKVFRRGADYYLFLNYWLPETMVDPQVSAEFAAWAAEGRINVSEGPVIDIELVRDSMKQDLTDYDLKRVGFDPAQLQQFATEMLSDGFPMVDVRPTLHNFSEPMKKMTELVEQGRLHHNGCPVLAWMVGNVVCHMNAKEEIYPRKIKGQERTKKIDGVIAALIALSRAIFEEDEGDQAGFIANPVVA